MDLVRANLDQPRPEVNCSACNLALTCPGDPVAKVSIFLLYLCIYLFLLFYFILFYFILFYFIYFLGGVLGNKIIKGVTLLTLRCLPRWLQAAVPGFPLAKSIGHCINKQYVFFSS